MQSRNISPGRKAGGAWLAQKRADAGLTQRELARLVGLDYYTFISQIEAGKGRVPPDRYAEFANALRIDVRTFAWEQLRFYEPEIYTFSIHRRQPQVTQNIVVLRPAAWVPKITEEDLLALSKLMDTGQGHRTQISKVELMGSCEKYRR